MMKPPHIALLFALLLTQSCTAEKGQFANDQPPARAKPKADQTLLRLHDIWVLTHIEGQPLSGTSERPRIEIYVADKIVRGFDGCHPVQGSITQLSHQRLAFGPLATRFQACEDKAIADAFHAAMGAVRHYELKNLRLFLFNQSKKQLLTFKKVD